MDINYKFLKPGNIEYPKYTDTPTFYRMFIPKNDEVEEKYCFVEIPHQLVEAFQKKYKVKLILVDEIEMPNSGYNIICGIHFLFNEYKHENISLVPIYS